MRLNFFILALAALLIFLQTHLWLESGGIRDMLQMRKLIADQQQENNALKQQNDDLLSEVQHLQNSRDAAESRARNDLGMIKKGETFYQIVTNDRDKDGT